MYTALIEVLKHHIILQPDDEKLVIELAQERDLKKGDYFLRAPSFSSEIGFVLSGILRYYYIDDGGNEVTAMFIQETDFFTDIESFKTKKPSIGYIQAVNKAKLLVFNRHAHETLTAKIHNWDRALLKISQERLVSQLKFTRGIIHKDAVTAYESFRTAYPDIANEIPNIYIASFLGITKYTLSRIKGRSDKD